MGMARAVRVHPAVVAAVEGLRAAARVVGFEVKATSRPAVVWVVPERARHDLGEPLYLGRAGYGLEWFWRSGDVIGSADRPGEVMAYVVYLFARTRGAAE